MLVLDLGYSPLKQLLHTLQLRDILSLFIKATQNMLRMQVESILIDSINNFKSSQVYYLLETYAANSLSLPYSKGLLMDAHSFYC